MSQIIVPVLLALVTSAIINNAVLMQFLGICPFLGVSKKMDSSIGMSAAVVFIMIISSAITYPIYKFILEPANIGFMSTLTFILVIATLTQFVELIIKKTSKGLYKSLGVYLPLMATNCIILGVVEENIKASSFGTAMLLTLGTGLGFALVMILFSSIRMHLETSNIPKPFKGVPIALITAGLLALAFSGFGYL